MFQERSSVLIQIIQFLRNHNLVLEVSIVKTHFKAKEFYTSAWT